jgi:hypothetical protein
MRVMSHLAVSLVAAVLWAAPADARIKVSFADPARYADGEDRYVNVRKDLRAYLQRLGGRLERGVDLNVTMLDIDLAGFDMSTRNPHRRRVLTAATWPKIRLRYVLTKNRKTIASGEEWLTDHFYRSRIGLASTNDPLRYEKNMLEDWFHSRFASHLKSGG